MECSHLGRISSLRESELAQRFELRFLSYVAKRGLPQYVRRVHICLPRKFTPDNLLPQLHHFRSLDRVHTLTIEQFDPLRRVNHYPTCFAHFYPTLTSLALSHPLEYHRLLRFALQLPHLENLCVEWWATMNLLPPPGFTVTIRQAPPLCGYLRLAGHNTMPRLDEYCVCELPNTAKFRSVELENFSGNQAQHILSACAHALEYLSIILDGDSMHQLLFFSLGMTKWTPNFPLAG